MLFLRAHYDSRRSDRMLRGGGWFYSAKDCRSADRYGLSPDDRNVDVLASA